MIHIVTKEDIQKGWSGEKKYRITDENGTPYLLRVANSSQKTKKRGRIPPDATGSRHGDPHV